MYTLKTASLVLKTSDITTSSDFLFNNTDYTGERGSVNKYLSSITWNNINLRQILGDMYDEYDEFNLVLKQLSTSFTNSTLEGVPTESRGIYMRISGLPFLNNTYNVVSKRNTNTAIIGTCSLTANSFTNINYNDSAQLTFNKSQELCNITITFNKVVDDTLVNFDASLLACTATTAVNNASISSLVAVANSLGVTVPITVSGLGYYISNANVPTGSMIISGAGTATITSSKRATIAGTLVPTIIYSTLPHFCLVFDIYGIPKEKNNLNNTRI